MRLTASKLAFGYPGKRVGGNIDLTVESGEVLCLLGPNGSGKTTLFKTLLGLLAPQGGNITLDGVSIAGWSRQRLARLMAYVPQAHITYFPFTVLDTVLMGRTVHIGPFATPSRQDIAVAETVLETLHISELKHEVYTRISGGQRQLVLIARALAQGPKILIMDEPTASLDFGNQVLVLKHIKTLAKQGMVIILSTHDPDHAFVCADRVALLHKGHLIRYGSPKEAITADSLWLVYGVNVEVVRLAGSDQRVCVPSVD